VKKIITIVGARPQFIKAAVVSRCISESNRLNEILVHTGQHFDDNMSDVFFREMEIPKPAYNLEINSLQHGAMTGRMLEKIEEILLKEKPDAVLVYGDTNSTLAGALAAVKHHIKIAHVEAGLRSFNISMPEEVNRILTDRISDLLFCPTQMAISNLVKEGFNDFTNAMHLVGDVMYDASIYYSKVSALKSTVINNLGLEKNKFVLVTVHRQENTNTIQNLGNIIEALNNISNEIQIVMPVHPRTAKIISHSGLKLNFRPIAPVGYFDMIELLKNCSLVLTDSGGLQKEAFFFKKQCITLREETEWVELINNGVNTLAGSDCSKIISVFKKKIDAIFPVCEPLYGKGNAGALICEILESL
jgi:UDP-GlcNAc3NAcA epimerase